MAISSQVPSAIIQWLIGYSFFIKSGCCHFVVKLNVDNVIIIFFCLLKGLIRFCDLLNKKAASFKKLLLNIYVAVREYIK